MRSMATIKKKRWSHIPYKKRSSSSWGTREANKFYSSSPWRNLRRMILNSEPFCRECGYPAKVVDHIQEINRQDPYDTVDGSFGEPLDPENCQPLCERCHNLKTSQHANRKNNHD